MNNFRIAIRILSLLVAFSPLCHARVGETLSQCGERYGQFGFDFHEGDLEMRVYRLQSRRVEVVYYKSVSVEECIMTGPLQCSSKQELTGLVRDWIAFARGVFSVAYSVPEKQLPAFADYRPITENVNKATFEYKPFIMTSTLDLSRYQQGTVQFRCFVGKIDAELLRLFASTGFFEKSEKAERKQVDSTKASGF